MKITFKDETPPSKNPKVSPGDVIQFFAEPNLLYMVVSYDSNVVPHKSPLEENPGLHVVNLETGKVYWYLTEDSLQNQHSFKKIEAVVAVVE